MPCQDLGSLISSWTKIGCCLMRVRLNEGEVDALSEHIAKNEIKDMTRLVKNEYSIPAFLAMFESWLRVSAFPYRRNTADNGGVQTFVIQHDMGPRWSTYFKKLIEFVFEDLGKKKPTFDTSDNAISFIIR
jgi:hypothetical protein